MTLTKRERDWVYDARSPGHVPNDARVTELKSALQRRRALLRKLKSLKLIREKDIQEITSAESALLVDISRLTQRLPAPKEQVSAEQSE